MDASIVSAARIDEPTVGDLIRRYMQKPPRALGPSHRYVLQKVLKFPITEKLASGLRAGDVLDHFRVRLKSGTQPSTIYHDLTFLRGVLLWARNEWHVSTSTAAVDEARQRLEQRYGTDRKERGRRPTKEEYGRLIEYFEKQDRRAKIKMADLMEFAVYSARRVAEICSLRWEDVDERRRTCILRSRVAPRPEFRRDHEFPLLGKAWDIVQRQPRKGARIFPYNSKSVSARFTLATRKLKISGLWFDDIRKEAETRLFEEGVPIQDVIQLTGHRSYGRLMRRYEAVRKSKGPASADAD